MQLLLIIVLSLASFDLTGVMQFNNKNQASPTMHGLEDPDLKIFADLIIAAELQDLFQGTGPFTAFIPSNAAFEKLGKNKLRDLKKPENKDQLVSILIYHIIPGKYLAENLKTKNFQTINGKNLNIDVNGETIRVNDAKVIKKDLVGPNGVIHEIDTVLIP